MAKRQDWLDQLNRYIAPLAVVGIGLYGTWDLIVQPLVSFAPPTQICVTQVFDVAVLKPSTKPDQPPKRVQAPEGLPIVVPAGEQRIFSVDVHNPDEKPVMYQWQATHGKFASRVTMEQQTTYTAPRSLVNDTITIETTVQGCSPVRRTINLAIIPSAKVPASGQPIPAPMETPTPLPSVPSSLPTIDPFAEPSRP